MKYVVTAFLVACLLGFLWATGQSMQPIAFPEGSFVTSKLTGVKGQVLSANPPCYSVRFLKPVGQPQRMMGLVYEECMREFELYKAEER